MRRERRHIGGVVCAAVFFLSPFPALCQSASDNELFAAYCMGALKGRIEAVRKALAAPCTDQRCQKVYAAARTAVARDEANLERIKRFLLVSFAPDRRGGRDSVLAAHAHGAMAENKCLESELLSAESFRSCEPLEKCSDVSRLPF